MTIYKFHGFEADDTIEQADGIVYVNSPTVSAALAHQTPGGFGGSRSMKLDLSDAITIPMPGALDDDEAAMAWYRASTGTPTWGIYFLLAGAVQASVICSGADGLVRIYRNASGTLLATSGASLSADTWYWVKVVANIDNSGQIDVYVNGTLFVSTGAAVDTQQRDAPGYDSMKLINSAGTGICYVDDWVWASTGVLPDAALYAPMIRPDADGATVDATPSTGSDNYAMVDEDPVSLVDYNTFATATDEDHYNLSNLSTAPGQVLAVRPRAHMTGEGTIINARTLVNSNGTVEYGTNQPLATGGTYAVIADVFETDPDTAATWTGTAVQALLAGAQVNT